jgi:hypothetical protein
MKLSHVYLSLKQYSLVLVICRFTGRRRNNKFSEYSETYLRSRRLCVRLVAELQERYGHGENEASYENIEDARHVA